MPDAKYRYKSVGEMMAANACEMVVETVKCFCTGDDDPMCARCHCENALRQFRYPGKPTNPTEAPDAT